MAPPPFNRAVCRKLWWWRRIEATSLLPRSADQIQRGSRPGHLLTAASRAAYSRRSCPSRPDALKTNPRLLASLADTAELILQYASEDGTASEVEAVEAVAEAASGGALSPAWRCRGACGRGSRQVSAGRCDEDSAETSSGRSGGGLVPSVACRCRGQTWLLHVATVRRRRRRAYLDHQSAYDTLPRLTGQSLLRAVQAHRRGRTP